MGTNEELVSRKFLVNSMPPELKHQVVKFFKVNVPAIICCQTNNTSGENIYV